MPVDIEINQPTQQLNRQIKTIADATQTAAGVMSAADKKKLDSIATGNQIPVNGTVKTPNNTSTPLVTVNLGSSPNSYVLTGRVSASFNDGSQSAGWAIDTGVYVDGTGAHILGTPPSTGPTASHGASASGWTLTLSVSGTSFTWSVVGDTTNPVNWQIISQAIPAIV